MRLISHFHQRVGAAEGVTVAVRYFSLECELEAMRGVRIPQLALTLQRQTDAENTESVDADADLITFLETHQDEAGVRELLNRLAGRFGGRPMGDLAVTAVGLLPNVV